ncbi:hypothetical protein L9F63_010224, partial [Diploptera punctata]
VRVKLRQTVVTIFHIIIMETLLYCVCFIVIVHVLPANTELQLVQVLFRHGERTPVDMYPKDPYINFTYPPFGLGTLTNPGKLQQYLQGQYLRTRYNEFLGHHYNSDVMYVQTTDMDRTKMSAQLVLAGLWPPAPAQLWNPDLHWQPIPTHSEPLKKDSLLLNNLRCPRYYYERQKVLNSTQLQDILNEYNATHLYETLSELTGGTFEDPYDVMSLYSTLKAEEGFNLTLPEWTRGIYPEKLLPLTIFSFTLNVYNTDMQKVKAGPLVKKLLNDGKAKAEGTLQPEGRKMYIYSGHDSTIVNLLSALQVWDPQIPDYGIMVLIELHHNKSSDQHYIKLFLRNTTEHEPYLLKLPGCETDCPLDQFISLTRPVIPVNWEDDCK